MRAVTLEEVIKATADHFKIPAEVIVDPSERTFQVTHARHVAQYVARKVTFKTMANIGRAFNQPTHSPCWAAFQKISLEIAKGNHRIAEDVNTIIIALGA